MCIRDRLRDSIRFSASIRSNIRWMIARARGIVVEADRYDKYESLREGKWPGDA